MVDTSYSGEYKRPKAIQVLEFGERIRQVKPKATPGGAEKGTLCESGTGPRL